MMEKLPQKKWVPVKSRPKKQQKEFYNQMRPPMPSPTIAHKSAKDYDRQQNQEIIDEESMEMWEDEDEQE